MCGQTRIGGQRDGGPRQDCRKTSDHVGSCKLSVRYFPAARAAVQDCDFVEILRRGPKARSRSAWWSTGTICCRYRKRSLGNSLAH